MKKLPFLTNERLSRLMVSLLLCMGLLVPLMFTFGAQSQLWLGIFISAALLALFMVLGSLKRGRLALAACAGAVALVQLLLPNLGLFGMALEALKAISLFFSNVPTAAPLFATEIAVTLATLLAVISYAFTSKSVGFMPATIVVVLTLFGMWSLGKAQYLWACLGALVALLLLISQTSHEKINLFEVLPMAAAVCVLAMLILPSGQTVVEPLYEQAMDLKQTITDYLFFTEPRNVFTLGNYGYYPMGSGKLGGEAEPSDYPVMTVKTSRRTLLRAVSKDEYTGRSWRDTSGGKRYLYVNPRWRSLRQQVFLENLPPDSVQGASTLLDRQAISVQMQNTATSTVFAPAFLRSFSAQSDMVAYFNDASELFITRDLVRDDRYTVFAPILEGGDSALGALISATPQTGDPNYAAIAKTYTQLPSHMEQKVFDDVANMVSGASTPYEKACAIMRQLQRYYRYTLSPETPPENQDFVTYFLYVGREGYCTYFASAMTVLCRMAGLPARYVEGFVAQPGADGFAYVTGKDAHAWTEVYFENFGWVPFDATPSQQNRDNNDTPPENSPEPTPSPTPPPPEEDQQDEPTPSPEPPQDQDEPDPTPDDNTDNDPNDDPPPFPWWLLLIAAAIAGLAVRVHLRMPDRVAKKKDTDTDRLFVYGSACATLVRLNGRKPGPGETPMLFARRMDRQKAFPVGITPLWRMMALVDYGGMEAGVKEVERARDIFRRFYKKQSPWRKLRFMLTAALSNRCYTALDTQVEHQEPKTYKVTFHIKTDTAKGKKQKPKPAASPEKPAPAPEPAPAPSAPTSTEPASPPPEAAPQRRRRANRQP